MEDDSGQIVAMDDNFMRLTASQVKKPCKGELEALWMD
jgi:hypothetical protein